MWWWNVRAQKLGQQVNEQRNDTTGKWFLIPSQPWWLYQVEVRWPKIGIMSNDQDMMPHEMTKKWCYHVKWPRNGATWSDQEMVPCEVTQEMAPRQMTKKWCHMKWPRNSTMSNDKAVEPHEMTKKWCHKKLKDPVSKSAQPAIKHVLLIFAVKSMLTFRKISTFK